MKKWIWLTAFLAAAAVLSRLPHPARDVAKLDPVRAVYADLEEGLLHLQTDTGSHGVGQTLAEAEADMRRSAEKEIFLDTAELLILHPDVPVTEDFFTLLSPSCYVCYSEEVPDLPAAAQYLSAHTPDQRLSHLRAKIYP